MDKQTADRWRMWQQTRIEFFSRAELGPCVSQLQSLGCGWKITLDPQFNSFLTFDVIVALIIFSMKVNSSAGAKLGLSLRLAWRTLPLVETFFELCK